jgi:hypothetical protein
MRTAYSTGKTVKQVARDLEEQFEGIDPRSILFFASSTFEPNALSLEIADSFGGATVFGCTTAGEIVSGRMLEHSVVAMTLGADILDRIKLCVIEDLHNKCAVKKAFATFEEYFKESMLSMDPGKYVGIILVDGLSKVEEKLMDRIGDLTNVPFVGGSAGDDFKFQRTYVFADGIAYSNAAVLALLKTNAGFDIIKTQSFCSLGTTLLATRVDEPARKVIEFNGKPAIEAYAEAIGTSAEEAPRHFMSKPVGVMIDGEPFVRSPQQVQGGSMVFLCNVKEGMRLSVLHSTDIVEDTRKALKARQRKTGNIRGIVNFHCILRTLELEKKGQKEAYAKIFANIPTIGFSTYGEQCIGHVNQTSAMLIFKGDK